MTLRLTIAMCLAAVFAPAARAQLDFDESPASEAAAAVADRATIAPVLPVLRPLAGPLVDADAAEPCGFEPQVARAYRAAEIADENEDCPEYLGRLSANPYASDSTANPYSDAGTAYSSKSVNNPYGPYGSPYSPVSARNPYATDAPDIVAQDGTYLGKLSDNPYDPDSAANPYGRYGSPYSSQIPNNLYATQAPLLFGD